MAKIVAFSGLSNSGKTTLIEKIALLIKAKNKSVFILKHDPKDKALFDTQGKDSHRFFQSGADVGVLSPTRSTFFLHDSLSLELIFKFFEKKDYILVEGLKELNLPRIVVARGELQEEYKGNAYALKDIFPQPKEISPILDLDNPQEVLEWIDKNIP